MAEEELALADVCPPKVLWIVRIVGPLLAVLIPLVVLPMTGGQITASSLGFGTLVSTALVVPVLVELLQFSLPSDVQVESTYDRGTLGRLFSNTVVAGVMWILISPVLGLVFGIPFVIVSSVFTLPFDVGLFSFVALACGLIGSAFFPEIAFADDNIHVLRTVDSTNATAPSTTGSTDAGDRNPVADVDDVERTIQTSIDTIRERIENGERDRARNLLNYVESGVEHHQEDGVDFDIDPYVDEVASLRSSLESETPSSELPKQETAVTDGSAVSPVASGRAESAPADDGHAESDPQESIPDRTPKEDDPADAGVADDATDEPAASDAPTDADLPDVSDVDDWRIEEMNRAVTLAKYGDQLVDFDEPEQAKQRYEQAKQSLQVVIGEHSEYPSKTATAMQDRIDQRLSELDAETAPTGPDVVEERVAPKDEAESVFQDGTQSARYSNYADAVGQFERAAEILSSSAAPTDEAERLRERTAAAEQEAALAAEIKASHDRVRQALAEDDFETATQTLTETHATLDDQSDTQVVRFDQLRADAARLRHRLDEQLDDQVDELLEFAETSHRDATELLQTSEYQHTASRARDGLDYCQRASELARKYDLDRQDEIAEVTSDLESLREQAEELPRLRSTAEEQLETVRSAHQAGNYDAASDVLETLEETISLLSAYEAADEFVQTISAQADALKADVTAERTRSRIDELCESAASDRDRAATFLADQNYDHAVEAVESALESATDAETLAERHGLACETDIAKTRRSLESFAERIETLSTLTTEAEEQRSVVRRSLRTRTFDTANEALDDLRQTIDELSTYEDADEVVTGLRGDVSGLEDEIDSRQAESRVDGLLGSVASGQSRAETYLDEGAHDRAVTRLESALDSLDEAKTLEERHDLGRASAIASRRSDVEALLSEAKARPAEDLTEHLESAEAAVTRGIDRRKADEPRGAVESFAAAEDDYDAALELAEEHDLPERWEVEERHSMVTEYLEVARDELTERERSVQTQLEHTLEDAESSLSRAEQHAEVDDLVSARETLADAIVSLDEATQLVETGVVSDDLGSRYRTLVNEADALYERLPNEDDSGEYRTRDLVESLQSLATKLGESPRPEFVNAYGEFPADAYLEAFGSWPEALTAANLNPVNHDAHERRSYSRVEVLDALVALADDLGHPPSKGEMNRHGEMSASPVESRFEDWETALELAGVTGEGGGRRDHTGGRRVDDAGDSDVRDGTDDTGDTDSTDDTVVNTSAKSLPEPNELAELYAAFGSLESVLDALITAEDTVDYGDGSPLAEWYDAVFDRWAGDGFEDAPNYGEQQHRRNDFSISDYRDAHGDGERVTEFTVVETRPLRQGHRRVFVDRGVIDSDESFSIPVAPEAGVRLPAVVRTDEELAAARALLAEFPPWPEATAPPGHDTSGETSEPDDSERSEQTDSSGADEPTRGELVEMLRELHRSHSRLPKATDVQHDETLPPVAVFRRTFGSWDDALAAAGISKEAALLDELRRVATELGAEPTTTDMNTHGVYSAGMYAQYFGSWSAAKARIDFEEVLSDHDHQTARSDHRGGEDDSESQGDVSDSGGDERDEDDIVGGLLDDMGLTSDTERGE